MGAIAYTVAFEGVEARIVEVQCAVSPGLPAFAIVGLPDKAVSEARERVRAALSALAIALPPKRITINLSPADLPKEGSHFDLPIALALLGALEIVPKDELDALVSIGELSLEGELVPVAGALPAAMAAATDNVGLFFGEDIFIAFGAVLLMQGLYAENGIVMEPLHIALWGIPTAILAFAIHAWRLHRFDKRMAKAVNDEKSAEGPADD